MTTTQPVATDAAGRPIAVGDLVGGTTSGVYQTTVLGTILNIGNRSLNITVTQTNRPHYVLLGQRLCIYTCRIFFVCAADEREQAAPVDWEHPRPAR